MASEAAVCRRSWRVRPIMPAAVQAGSKAWVCRFPRRQRARSTLATRRAVSLPKRSREPLSRIPLPYSGYSCCGHRYTALAHSRASSAHPLKASWNQTTFPRPSARTVLPHSVDMRSTSTSPHPELLSDGGRSALEGKVPASPS